jgi:hypothetical protein
MNVCRFVVAIAFTGLACPAAVRADDPYRPAIEEPGKVMPKPNDTEAELRRIVAELQKIKMERDSLRENVLQRYSTGPERTLTSVRLMRMTDHGVQEAPPVPVEWDGNTPTPRRVLK